MRAVLLTTFASIFILATGCAEQSQCHTVCGQTNACSIAERAADTECTTFCADVEAMNARIQSAAVTGTADCEAKFQEHLTCWEQNNANICTKGFGGCEAAGKAWTACMTTYCASEAAATDPSCSSTKKPTLLPF